MHQLLGDPPTLRRPGWCTVSSMCISQAKDEHRLFCQEAFYALGMVEARCPHLTGHHLSLFMTVTGLNGPEAGVEFTFQNWKSFRDATTFSMLAGWEEQYVDRIALVESEDMRVLPIGVVFGGNGAGKTNFFEALKFAKSAILQEILFKILAGEVVFEYSFSLTRTEVSSERLIRFDEGNENIVFTRSNGDLTIAENDKERSIAPYQGRLIRQ